MVLAPLKNISQIGSSSQLLGKIKNVANHQPVYIIIYYIPGPSRSCDLVQNQKPNFWGRKKPESNIKLEHQTPKWTNKTLQ